MTFAFSCGENLKIPWKTIQNHQPPLNTISCLGKSFDQRKPWINWSPRAPAPRRFRHRAQTGVFCCMCLVYIAHHIYIYNIYSNRQYYVYIVYICILCLYSIYIYVYYTLVGSFNGFSISTLLWIIIYSNWRACFFRWIKAANHICIYIYLLCKIACSLL
jgi:hypothetical protein